jgi:hypothetical protein
VAVSKKGMLADLFDGTFRTLSGTWLTSLVCGGIIFIPVAIFSWWSYGRFFGALAGVSGLIGVDHPVAKLLPLGLGYLWIMLAVLAQGLALLFVRACVTESTARVVRGERADPLAIAGHVFTRFYGRLIGQRALQYAILGVAFGAAMALGAAALAIGTAAGAELFGVLGIVVFTLAGVCVTYLFAIRWSLTLESIVLEDRRIDASLDRSTELVRGAWWRICGFMLLVSMMVSFGVSLIATPLVFFATIRRYVELVGGLLQGADSSQDMMSLMRSLFSGLAPSLAILTYVQSLLSTFVVPVFMTLLFLELRRRTDAPDPAEAAVAPESPAAPVPPLAVPVPVDPTAPGSP